MKMPRWRGRSDENVADGIRTHIALDDLSRDLRLAWRSLGKNRGFTLAAVLTLALGIGANTAIFSLINTVILRPLPVRQPEQLVELLFKFPGDPRLNMYSWMDYVRLRDAN